MALPGALRSNGGLLLAYYGATPVFWAADFLAGWNVRAAFLPLPRDRLLYYAFCAACGLVCWRAPRYAAWAGLLEASVCITLLAVSFMLPILTLADLAATGDPAAAVPTTGRIVNFALSAAVMWVAFQQSQRALLRGA